MRAVIALGSNLSDREAALDAAVAAIAALPGTAILKASRRYDTTPQDVPPQFADLRFLNAALLIQTNLSPRDLLAELNAIEAHAGRVRTLRNGPRPIDLDIILYEGVSSDDPALTLPHPRAHLRDFVLLPLADLGVTRADLLANTLPRTPPPTNPKGYDAKP